METVTFKLSDPHRQKTKQVSWSTRDNPSLNDLVSAIPQEMGIPLNRGESLRLYNETRKKPLVKGPLHEQIGPDDEIVYASEGVAGSKRGP